MTFPPPPPSAQSSIASGTDKSSSSSSSKPTRSHQSAWGSTTSQPNARRGLTPLATSNLSSFPSTGSRGPSQSGSPGPTASTSSPLNSSFSAVLSSARGLPGNRNGPSPASTPSPFTSLQSGLQQHHHIGQPLSSPKFRAHTPSLGSHLASAPGNVAGGGGSGGGGGGTGSSRGVAFSPLLAGTTVNSPTGLPSEKPGSAAPGSAAAHASQSSLTKISIAQVFLLLDSITEKEGKEKWETKAAQIHKVCSSPICLFPLGHPSVPASDTF